MYQHLLARLARAVALLSLCANLPAAVIDVDIAGGGEFTAIQPAIDAAVDGDEIIIHPGLYLEKIEFKGKDIVVRSTDLSSPSVVASTIIDAEQTGSTVTFDGSEPETAELSGLTIRGGGGATAFTGGGVSGADSLAAIRYNHILLNRSVGNGGGLHHCHGDIIGNTIEGNVAHTGQGGGLFNCDGLVRCNLIVDNHAQLSGGGAAYCDGVIENCRVTSNTATQDGGGLAYCEGIIRNCVLDGNVAEEFSAFTESAHVSNNVIYGNLSSDGYNVAGYDILKNSLHWNNRAVKKPDPPYINGGEYCGAESIQYADGTALSDQDPLFVDPQSGDFRLRPSSPYIDAGHPETRYFDSGAGQGTERSDIGAYGGVGARSVIGVDVRPTVQINKPQLFARIDHSQDSFGVEGEARAGARPLGAVEWRVNGSAWSPATGQRDWSCTATRLIEGANVIEARARDVDGRVSDHARAIVARSPADGVWRVNDAWDPPKFQSVQSALLAADEGDTVLVDDGRYRGSLIMPPHDIVLAAVNPAPPPTVSSNGSVSYTEGPAVIDLQRIGSALELYRGTSSACEVRGLAFVNGYESEGAGFHSGWSWSGATIRGNQVLFCESFMGGAGGIQYCSGLIEGNLIYANQSTQDRYGYDAAGGLLRCGGVVRNNTISNNLVHGGDRDAEGGGLRECDGLIEGNAITFNWAETRGSGLYMCNGEIRGNTIRGHTTNDSGAALYRCDGLIVGNTITGNGSQLEGGALYRCDGPIIGNTISYNSSQADGGALYRCLGPITGNTFTVNGAGGYGGALYRCTGEISGNTIDSNFCSETGAGLYDCPGDIIGNDIIYNYAELGGGAAAMCDGLIQGNIISHNTSYNSSYPYNEKEGALYDCYADIIDNLISYNIGGAAWCYGRIEGNTFVGNDSEYGGAAKHCSGVIRNNAFTTNSARYGGALYWSGSLIEGNAFSGNETYWSGGAIYRPGGRVAGNEFVANRSRWGGAIGWSEYSVDGNTFIGNQCQDEGGALTGCSGEVANNLFYRNKAGYSFRRWGSGGAVNNCHGWIHANEFRENQANEYGGAASWCDGLIERNAFSGNRALYGGVIARSSADVRANTFVGNEATRYGGAIYYGRGTVENNLFISNAAVHGGALYEAQGDVINNTIWGNQALRGGGLYDCEGDVRNNIVWANTATTDSQISNSSALFFSCVQDGPTNNGNINVDPLLRSPATGDFTLAAGSPCIDAGDPAAAMNDACLPPGLATVRNDMGAYGGPFNCLLGSDAVTVEEVLHYLLTGWGSPSLLDVNGDGAVDIADVAFMNIAAP